MWNSMPKESKRIVGTFKVWRGLRKSRKLHKGGQSMTKTWLWFRIETDTESKNGRKFRPDTETNQNQQIFQKTNQFYNISQNFCHIFRKLVSSISSSAGSYADTKTQLWFQEPIPKPSFGLRLVKGGFPVASLLAPKLNTEDTFSSIASLSIWDQNCNFVCLCIS